MCHEDFVGLCDSSNTVSQLLLAHFVALHLIMRPISCRERMRYTVTMYSIRMTTWIDLICQNLHPDSRVYLIWPNKVNQLNDWKVLDSYTVS
jgi:hypothetical protein